MATWILRRVLPLQRRAHRICDMGGHRDRSRTCTVQLERDEVRNRVCAITELKIDEKWWFGMMAFTRNDSPPQVHISQTCSF